MPMKKRASIAGLLEEAVGDLANATSVAATGSELGVLELAVEDKFKPRRPKRARKAKSRKKAAPKRSRKKSNKARKKPEKRKRVEKKRY